MDKLKTHIQSVISQVQGLLDQGRVPNPQQLEAYTQQVVTGLKGMIAQAPPVVKHTVARPFTGSYDFENNKAINGNANFTANNLIEILEDIMKDLDKGMQIQAQAQAKQAEMAAAS